MSLFLECRGLTKVYKNFVLGPIDLALEEGWFYALVGPNGAGKTTFLRTLLTLAVPTRGELRLWGLAPLDHEVEVKRRIGFVLDRQFDQTMASWEEVGKFLSRLYPTWDDGLYRTLVKRMGLETRTKVHKFSTGNKNALALVCALAHRPDLLVLDEPTAGLDPAARAEALDLLREFQSHEGKTVLFSTHLVSDLESVADQILFLADGRIRETGSPQDLGDRYRLVKTATAPGVETALVGARTVGPLTVGLTNDPASWTGRTNTLVERPTLEEVFVHLIRGGRAHEW